MDVEELLYWLEEGSLLTKTLVLVILEQRGLLELKKFKDEENATKNR